MPWLEPCLFIRLASVIFQDIKTMTDDELIEFEAVSRTYEVRNLNYHKKIFKKGAVISIENCDL
jgi:hypothetical protein